MEQGVSESREEATSEEVKELRRENRALKESLAYLVICCYIVKKLESAGLSSKWTKYMRLSAEEKAEIVLLASRSYLGINSTLSQLGIHKQTFYNWYHAYNEHV